MAKESKKARECKLKKLVFKYSKSRKEAKAKGDYQALQKLPRNSSPIRITNRCSITGRPRGYMRFFGVSRVKLREMANQGLIPGVRKSSW